jgi:serine protease inhibitor
MKPKIIIVIITFLSFSCEKNNIEELPAEPIPLNLSEKAASVIESDNSFGFNMFRQVVENDESENLFISPTSIALALAMTYNGAEGETKAAFEIALNKQGLTKEEINESYKSLIGALQSVDPRVLLEIANSIWYDEGFNVLQAFKDINMEYYNAEVSSLNFSDPASAGNINAWVEDKTNGLIEKIIDNIPANVVMYLINAIYFKGIWKYEFDKTKTVEAPFHLYDGGSVSNNFMKQELTIPYMSNNMFAMAEFPYGQGNFSMVVLLPHEGFTTGDIINSLSSESWNSWISGMNEMELNVALPKLRFSYKNLLNNELANLGMGIAFSSGADFSGINGSGGLYISQVIHKAFVEVNEQGTEAAAVTAVSMMDSYEPVPIFDVNRPYLFALRETTTGAILFLGLVKNPTIEENGKIE